MDSQETIETVMLEVLGARMRVRIPASNVGDLHHAAELVRQRVQERRAVGDKPENAAIQVALDIAYEAILSHRKMERAVSQLLNMLDESERHEAAQIVAGEK